jgi:hypothetical protein
MTDSMKVAVFGCMLLVGTGGGALVGWSFGKNGPGKGPANSPVVVRGGSMTARTTETTNGWMPTAGGPPFCTNRDASVINFVGAAGWKGTNPPTSVTPTADWTLKIYGRKHLSGGTGDESGRGIELTGNLAQFCSGATGGESVQLTATGMNGGFYDRIPSVNEDTSGKIETGKRFRDLTTDATNSNCGGPDAGSGGDEDECERASHIILSYSSTTYEYKCTIGECIVFIGDPQSMMTK